MDAEYSKLKEALSKIASAVSEAQSLCDGMSGEESSEEPKQEYSGSSGGDNKIKAAVAKIRMGKA